MGSRRRRAAGPITPDEVAKRLGEELNAHYRAPVHLPRAHALALLGWLRAYRHRVQAVLDDMATGPYAVPDDARQQWQAALTAVLDPRYIERPVELGDLPVPEAPVSPPPRASQLPDEPEPVYDPEPLPWYDERTLREHPDD